MKVWQKYLVSFLVGAGTVMFLLPFMHYRDSRDIEMQKDTVERKIYVSYSGLDLKKNTYEMELMDFGKLRRPLYFYIPKDSVRIEYRDTGKTRTEYIVLPRKAYHTKMKDINIWHSGVDSQIDSVQFQYTNQTITEQRIRRDWKHEVRFIASAGYCQSFQFPFAVEYCYYPKRWIGVGGRVEHDLLIQNTSILVTANIRFGW